MSSSFQPHPSLIGDNQAKSIAAIVFISIALYNALELMVLIPLTFKTYRSLYFWSLLLSAVLGIIPTSLGTSFQFFALAPLWLSLLLSNIGFIMLVPTQSVVLYSRLHLISTNYRLLRALKWLIIIDTIILVIPTVTLNFGSEYFSYIPSWVRAFDVVEKIQVTWFAAQETLISGVYIYETVAILRISPQEDKRRHKILYELIAINVTAICMDVALLVLEYMGFYFTQIIFKALVYSIKLKLEFAVLSMLISMVHSGSSHGEQPSSDRSHFLG